jgi:hypothetical protein
MKHFMIFMTLVYSQLLWARSFENIKIPGAKCGNGADYEVFVSKLNDEKLIVEFMGGGACWDRLSCFELPRTWIRPIPNINVFSTLTASGENNPYIEHSMLYFPYCTGDVHIGNHVAVYDGKTVYHNGRNNINLALKYLAEKKIIEFKNFKDVTVWGASAGAIAALIYAKKINGYLAAGTKKTLIADSPGMHFGEHFWDKFPQETKKDFDEAFRSVNLNVDFNDGFVARKFRPVFEIYKEWNFGILLATRDTIMSAIFGEISPSEQEKLILGPEGLPAIARGFPNVKVWLNRSYMHTFLILGESAEMESTKGESAMDFVKDVYFVL